MPQRFNPNLYLTLCEFVVVSGLTEEHNWESIEPSMQY